MNENARDMKMLYKLIRNLLPVQILMCAVNTVNGIVSSYLASNFIGVSAMSAVGLYSPLGMAVTSSTTVLVIGSSILCGKHSGRNELEKLQSCFSLSIILTLLISVGFTILFAVLGLFDLTGLFTKDLAVRPLFNRYLIGQAAGVVPSMLGGLLSVYLSLENRQARIFSASAAYIGTNTALGFLFVIVLKYQALGLALASSIGLWVFCAVQGFYFLSGRSRLRFRRKNLSLRESAGILKTGVPGALQNWYIALRGQIVNQLILAFVGSVGISAFTAANNLLAIFWAIPNGMVTLSRILMSISIGEEDRESLADVMRAAFRRYVPFMCAVAVLLIVCAVPLTRFFYKDPSDPVYSMTVWALRILPMCMPFAVVCMHFICYSQLAGKRVLFHVLSLVDGVAAVAAFSALLTRPFGVNGVCWANVINGVITVAVVILFSWVARKRFPRNTEQLMVIPEDFGVSEQERMDLRVLTDEDVVTVSEKVIEFCEARGIGRRRAFYSGLCLEEMAANVVDHGFTKDNKSHTVDIRVVHKDDDVILRIKDDCIAFDPEKRLHDSNSEDMTKNIGIRLVLGLAKDVQYQNTLGLNVLTIRI